MAVFERRFNTLTLRPQYSVSGWFTVGIGATLLIAVGQVGRVLCVILDRLNDDAKRAEEDAGQ